MLWTPILLLSVLVVLLAVWATYVYGLFRAREYPPLIAGVCAVLTVVGFLAAVTPVLAFLVRTF